jgi:hypothetical protein
MFDLMLTMTALFIIGSTIFPMVLSTMSSSVSERDNNTATVILYEKLNELLAEKKQPEYQLVIKRGKVYEFHFFQSSKKVCIQFYDRIQTPQTICEYWE